MDSLAELRRLLEPMLEPSDEVDPGGGLDVPPGTRLASVLVPILTAAPEPRLVFTRRTDTLTRHPGEISFPGGLADEGESLAQAALREAEEELGLAPDDVELVGALPPVHTRVTGILIVPFVGLLRVDPRFTPNPAEIADVLEFPLAHLVAAGALEEWEWEGRMFETHVFDMSGHVIWGATARILASFIELLETAPIPEGGVPHGARGS
jgi:8-oxo-dGTP pyrophosphatase MutT (NUDIX family)